MPRRDVRSRLLGHDEWTAAAHPWMESAYTAPVRRLAAVAVLVVIAVLPVIDSISCPDGCTDALHATSSWEHSERCGGTGGCGVCLNASYVQRDAFLVVPLNRIVGITAARISQLPSPDSDSVERPPRIA